jgi:hypothetical protein
LRDFFEKTIQEFRTPFSGVMLYVLAVPPVNQGKPLAVVGHLKTREKDLEPRQGIALWTRPAARKHE